MRRLVILAATAAAVVLTATPASAHGDAGLVGGEFVLGPGESTSFVGDVHYHRLVAHLSSSGPVSLELVDETSESVVLATTPADDVKVNQLIRCCDDMAWAPHRLVIRNQGAGPVTVTGSASFVHDDLAVSVFRAEAGVVESMLVLGVIWIWALARTGRRPAGSARAAVTTIAVVAGVTAVTAAVGMLRYGAGSAGGLLAGASDIPLFPRNPIVSRASVVIFALMAGWAVAGARWAAARPRMSRRAWRTLGVTIAGAVFVAGALVTAEYGTGGVPLYVGTLAAGPVLYLLVTDTVGETPPIREQVAA